MAATRRAPVPWRTLGPIAAVAVAYGWASWAHRWLYEDGLINVRIIENLLNGDGPVFNVGERIETYTSPAQIAFVALGRALTFGLIPLEDVLFLVGVASATAGVALAMLGAVHLWAADDDNSWSLPVGALAFAAVPAAWHYATSGHEGGLSYLWIGGSFWIVARRARELRGGLRAPVDRPALLLVVLGSGAMVRPEYLLYSVCVGAAWVWLHRETGGSRLRAVATMASLTVAYQVFRMGYFGLLLPNTAVAKLGAGLPPGWHYLNTFLEPYALAIPLVVVAIATVVLCGRSGGRERMVVAAFVVPGLVQVAFLVQIGGDYLNGRLLLPPLLALVAPVAVVPSRLLFPARDRERPLTASPWAYGLAVLVLWAGACATTMRPPWNFSADNYLDPMFDAREFTIRRSLHDTPSRRLAEYESSFLSTPYRDAVKARAMGYPDVLSSRDEFLPQQVTLPPGSGPAILTRGIGAVSALAWPDAHVYDRLGLADPIASHVPPAGRTPGHVRSLPAPWFHARAGVVEDPSSAAAARAMACGDLAQLLKASQDPLPPGRFLSNIVHAPTNTFLEVPKDPDDAVDTFC